MGKIGERIRDSKMMSSFQNGREDVRWIGGGEDGLGGEKVGVAEIVHCTK